MKMSIHSASPSGPSSHVAMLMLHAAVMLHAGVLLAVASAIDEWHRAGRRDDCSCLCSAEALQIALAEQPQLSKATCSPRSHSLRRRGWRAYFGACAMCLYGFSCN